MSTRRRGVLEQRNEEPSEHVRLLDLKRGARTAEGYEPIVQPTTRGAIEMRYYAATGATRGAIFVGGAGGGFDTPVCGWLYPRLCEALSREDGVAGLRVRYRRPNRLEESVMDVLAGVGFLESQGVTSIALVGHSFGGAVAIRAASLAPAVRTCVAMSTQTYGVGPAATLGPRCSLLLAHGTADEVLPPKCSEYVYSIAREPKKLLLKEGAHHGLDEWAEELPGVLRAWIGTELGKGAGDGAREC